MAVGVRELARALDRFRTIDQWILVEEATLQFRRTLGPDPARAATERRELVAHVFRDSQRGRGHALVTATGLATDQLADALRRASDHAASYRVCAVRDTSSRK